MSRHFNYELDERRIKILLKENSMPYSDDVWNNYLVKTVPLTKVNKLQGFKPNISFAINKSVLLTGVFIILIGSFTFLIAKFVDFGSARSNTETVREVKPEPDNYKLEKIATSMPVKKEEVKVVPLAAMDSILQAKITNTSIGVTPTQNIAVETKTISEPNLNEENKSSKNNPDTSITKSDKDTAGISQKNNEKYPRRKKKKQVEAMESKPLTSELPTSSTKEPELELK